MRVRDMEIGEVQERFANLVWDHEPIPSSTAPCRPSWRPLPPRRACLPRRRRKFSR